MKMLTNISPVLCTDMLRPVDTLTLCVTLLSLMCHLCVVKSSYTRNCDEPGLERSEMMTCPMLGPEWSYYKQLTQHQK